MELLGLFTDSSLIRFKHQEQSYHFYYIFAFQMQLSEVIIRARRYYQQVSGEEGFVHEGKVNKDAFESRFKEHAIHEGNEEVQEWLSNMTADKKGWE